METKISQIITPEQLLAHWQGHRALTRKCIEVFPEKEFFEYSLGGMRTFSKLIEELIAIGAPGLRQLVTRETEELNEKLDHQNSKMKILDTWDEATKEIDNLWKMLPEEKFHDEVVTFGAYPGTVLSSILYFIDNEIHHRGQAYVYLRTLGIEPPYFWER